MMATHQRIGHGYDVHPFAFGRELVLGGVTIPYLKGLHGHSDADVLTHAVCDALLGAAGLGDIGRHFPDDDPDFTGAHSIDLLRSVVGLLAGDDWRVVNVDVTLIAEKPKILPHVGGMIENLGEVLASTGGVAEVNIKATTNEGLGYIGRGEGIASHAVALIEKD
ncbi:MAG: 2-C-methyl-D-erythritol 2,4-cyclodiphosphate synthase [Candidatus Sumerlaeota bacterium]